MTSSDLQNLYQELILDHSRTPHGFGLRDEIPAQGNARSAGDGIPGGRAHAARVPSVSTIVLYMKVPGEQACRKKDSTK